jgi:hypothetical protein
MARENSTDKNGIIRISEKAGRFVGMLLGVIRFGNEIQRDVEFLGYESFSRLNRDLLKAVPPIKSTTKHTSTLR